MDRTVTNSRSFANPLHAILLAFPVALYPAALLTDITYLNTAEIQWSNFSSWLIAGADLFAGLVLASALLAIFFGRARHAKGRGTLYLIVIAAMFGLGVLNAFQHARDGWHSVGTLGLNFGALPPEPSATRMSPLGSTSVCRGIFRSCAMAETVYPSGTMGSSSPHPSGVGISIAGTRASFCSGSSGRSPV